MPEQRISTGYKPRPWQLEVHKTLKRFSVLVVHRRGGKTVLAVNTLIDAALRCTKNQGRFGYIAPFQRQARQIAWDYFRVYTEKIPGMVYRELTMQVEFPNGTRIQLYGADNPDALRGLYFDGVVMDEVADMRPSVWGEVVRPALADRKGWALFIGTPKGINLFSETYFRAVQDPEWAAGCYTHEDTEALDPKEVARAKSEMTEAQFAQELMCDFHAAVENALISVGAASEAMKRGYSPHAFEFAPKVMGIDVAWLGNDRSAIARRQGVMSHNHVTFHGMDPMDFANQCAIEIGRYEADTVFVDVGYAPGVYSRLLELGFPVIPVNFGGKADDPRFENKRAEMWFRMADWIKEAAIPDDHELLNDLCAPTYSMANRHGRIALESKDDLRKRGLRSPDIGDAYALTFAFALSSTITDKVQNRGKAVTEYNVLEG